MSGWENDRGAYYINKLSEAIGKLSSLATTIKTSIVSAINEVFDMAKSTKITNPLTMEEGFTTSELSAYKQGKIAIVNYQFNLANLTANTNTKIGTFTDAIKPAETHFFTGLIGSYANSGTPCKFILKTDGSINVSVPSNVGESAVAVRGSFNYVSV